MKRLLIIFIMIYALSLSAFCWNDDEMSDIEFMELDGFIVLSFKNALNCESLSGINVTILGQSASTDMNGFVKLPISLIEDIEDSDLPFTASKTGFITLKDKLEIRMGTTVTKHFLMSPTISIDKVRFVLQWGKYPRDLDLHLKSEDFHVSYRNMINVSNKAKLDIDDVSSFGPETITIDNITSDKVYNLFVHNYSNDGKISSDAKIYVYANNRLEKTINLPNTNKRYVNVLLLKNGIFTYMNSDMTSIE